MNDAIGFDAPGPDWPDDGTLELYALDALDDVQRARVDRAIAAADPSTAFGMRERIRQAREVAADLVAGAGLDTIPPPALRDVVLAAVAERDASGTAGAPAPAGGRKTDVEAVTDVVERRRQWWMPAAAAAAVAVLAGGVIAGTVLRGGDSAGPEGTQSSTVEASGDGMYEQIMAAPDMSGDTVDMGSHGIAEVVSSRSVDMGVVTFTGMPAASDGMRYQLWLVEPTGQMVALPALQTRADGTMISEFSGLREADEVMLTEEPMAADPSASPTGDMLVSLDLR